MSIKFTPGIDYDISTNVALILAKINKKIQLILKLSNTFLKDDKIEKISAIKPGFINIKFKPSFWTNFY